MVLVSSLISDFCSADIVLLKLATHVLLLLRGGLPRILPSYLCFLWFTGLSESESSSHLRLDEDEVEFKENDLCGVVVAGKEGMNDLNVFFYLFFFISRALSLSDNVRSKRSLSK